MADRTTLVKSVLTSIAIYLNTGLNIPIEVVVKIDSIRRSFLWASCDKVVGGKCKVNWEGVCNPKEYGGIVIRKLPKFTAALHMCWLWHERNDDDKPWVGLETPCTPQYIDLFAAATKVSIGNGNKSIF
jgi:hypothetical protein